MSPIRRERTSNNRDMRRPQEFLTVAEVVERLRINRAAVYRAVNTGEIPCVRIGRSIRIPAAWLELEAGRDARP